VTLAEIELDVYRRLDYADAPPTSVSNRVRSYINQRHVQIVSADRMRALRYGSMTLNSVADQAEYPLTAATVKRVTRITDTDNEFELAAVTQEWYRQQFPDPPSETGTPGYWVSFGVAAPAQPVTIALAPTPAAVVAYRVEYERTIPPLALPTDVPLLPADFHDLLCLYGRLDEYEYKSDDRWQTLMAQVQDRLSQLRAFVENHNTFKAHAVPLGRPHHSRLGPWFPAGA